ncbi:hypothetical protein Tsubulata_010749 [Turnera subulata]|uniref:Protein kinase domain-containing protein n=1 Tax=Turnera subulata TaxID=218843 RepID=A0A9Q0FM42_9ROSI|nr:hypothetical protein Tsubulata_010749 [Turnera subulata]
MSCLDPVLLVVDGDGRWSWWSCRLVRRAVVVSCPAAAAVYGDGACVFLWRRAELRRQKAGLKRQRGEAKWRWQHRRGDSDEATSRTEDSPDVLPRSSAARRRRCWPLVVVELSAGEACGGRVASSGDCSLWGRRLRLPVAVSRAAAAEGWAQEAKRRSKVAVAVEQRSSSGYLYKLLKDQEAEASNAVVEAVYGKVVNIPMVFLEGKLHSPFDIYSLGIVMLEMMTGQNPVDRTGPGEVHFILWAHPALMAAPENHEYAEFATFARPLLDAGFPQDRFIAVMNIVKRCLPRQPEDRTDITQVVQALQAILDGP